MRETAEGVWGFVKRYGLLEAGDTVVAGVSGGADSVCLLLVLREIAEAVPIRLAAVHVHHGIRKRADQDEEFVRELCGRLAVPCRVFREDVPGYAEKMGLSVEEAGRELRYRDFEKALRDFTVCQAEAGKIAVAHHADDCAETLLFHLFRGTGLTGMGSIRPRRGRVVRPLLELSRAQIEAYLKEQGQPWRTDETNEGDFYTRNKIRHHILPYAEREICRGAGAHLAREAALLAQTADYMHHRTEEALERCLAEPAGRGGSGGGKEKDASFWICAAEGVRLSAEAFRREEELLQSLMLQECIRQLGRAKNMTGKHVETLAGLFRPDCRSGSRVSLSGIRGVREFSTVFLAPDPAARKPAGRMPEDSRPGPEEKREPEGSRSGLEEKREPEGSRPGPGEKREPEGSRPGPGEKREPEGSRSGTGVKWPPEGLPAGPGMLWLPGLGEICCRVFLSPAEPDFLEKIPRNQYTKWFDYDKIIQSARFRTRRPGDYLTIDGQLHHKKLQDYMIEEKIPVTERDTAVLLADGAHIMWVPGHRISAAYRVTKDTKRILEVYVRGGT